MATYSEQDKERMLKYPITSILRLLGRRTDHQGCMYYSPFRDESSPSMHINEAKNIWNDFGEGSGGNVFTLVTRLLGLRGGEAWDYLAGLDPNVIPEDLYRPVVQNRSSRIIIDQVETSINRGFLIRYALRRGIPEDVLQRYCSQVTYHIEGYPCSRYTAIGFPSGPDGWVLRRASEDPRAKRCTSASTTTVSPDGEFGRVPGSGTVVVLEGFFDFLSWQVLSGRDTPGCDVCILNSVTNVDRALPFILSHAKVDCWLDNDRAGREAFGRIMQASKGREVLDSSTSMGNCKDLNEYLIAHRPVQAHTIETGQNIISHSLTL